MDRLKRFVVPVDIIVLGESAEDAVDYVHDAMRDGWLEFDGMVAYDDQIDTDDVYEQDIEDTE